ncbi:hypothetical protein [Priestia megaterium]|uniref:hypothetical protein n=1 Tax=Priestia megaterium TaxID=1404 RepID=UPI0031015EF9
MIGWFILSGILTLYGYAVGLQGWEGEFEFYLKVVCLNTGLLGMIIFGFLAAFNYIKEHKDSVI